MPKGVYKKSEDHKRKLSELAKLRTHGPMPEEIKIKISKALSGIPKNKSGVLIPRSVAIRKSNLKQNHGKTLEEYNRDLKSQDGVCAICGCPQKDGKSLFYDHDHECCGHSKSCSKCQRGLLCSACNKLLGFSRDNILILEKAILYLKKHSRRIELKFVIGRLMTQIEEEKRRREEFIRAKNGEKIFDLSSPKIFTDEEIERRIQELL